MADTYDIIYGENKAGTAKVGKQGLYCCFSCRCRLPDQGLYRIHVICGGSREDLGICVPMEGAFGMDKRIPAKRLGEGTLTFELVPKDWQPPTEELPQSLPAPQEDEPPVPVLPEELPDLGRAEEIFIPVFEEEPFENLDKLEDAVMEIRDDQVGIVIQEQE